MDLNNFGKTNLLLDLLPAGKPGGEMAPEWTTGEKGSSNPFGPSARQALQGRPAAQGARPRSDDDIAEENQANFRLLLAMEAQIHRGRPSPYGYTGSASVNSSTTCVGEDPSLPTHCRGRQSRASSFSSTAPTLDGTERPAALQAVEAPIAEVEDTGAPVFPTPSPATGKLARWKTTANEQAISSKLLKWELPLKSKDVPALTASVQTFPEEVTANKHFSKLYKEGQALNIFDPHLHEADNPSSNLRPILNGKLDTKGLTKELGHGGYGFSPSAFSTVFGKTVNIDGTNCHILLNCKGIGEHRWYLQVVTTEGFNDAPSNG